MKAENYKEFELKVETYILKQKNRNLSKKKKRLKKDIKKYEKLNNELMRSNSWKITKPLRKIMGVFRND